ncbi:hypothetical protein JEM51_06830 [Ligilactobacillus agilis]|uniref:hypothetical protein n=1 Tax=Ligilactobacillus agilis TaxID=1601 RepID=UPI00191EA2D6|nr:hypothetical protein [Ligilactobacillus agilis]MBL1056137.1 hypothetical protein [Ligilactobacillus agilis]
MLKISSQQITIALWLLTIMLGIGAYAGYANQHRLAEVRSANHDLRFELKHVQGKINQASPLAANYNIASREAGVTQDLNDAFTTLYGGLHSQADVNRNRNKLERILGKKLVKTALPEINGMVADNNQGEAAQKQFVIQENNGVHVGFMSPMSRYETNILVTVAYKLKGNVNQVKVYRLAYNLDKQQVKDFEVLK